MIEDPNTKNPIEGASEPAAVSEPPLASTPVSDSVPESEVSPQTSTQSEVQPEIEVETQPEPEPVPEQPTQSMPPHVRSTDLSISSPSAPQQSSSHMKELWLKFREKVVVNKNKKLEKIIALALKKGRITNDDVQELLRVSDATATRYLQELVRQGRLKRSGTTSGITYEPTP